MFITAHGGAIFRTARRLRCIWSCIWFKDVPTTPLEITRIGLGAAMLVNYGLAVPYVLDLWGPDSWVSLDSVYSGHLDWRLSIFHYTSTPLLTHIAYAVFIASCIALMVGWHTKWTKWIVMAGHLSCINRNPVITYGVDYILCCLLFILCLAPIGQSLSFDRRRTVRNAKKLHREAPPCFSSPWTGACIRLMQIQMATLFFYSGVNKIRSDEWWNGDVLWMVFSLNEFQSETLLGIFAHAYWTVNLGTYAILILEMAFPFLIWQQATRPYLLAAAIVLHIAIGLMMGMPYFSFVMIMGHMSFVRQAWLDAALLLATGSRWQSSTSEVQQ